MMILGVAVALVSLSVAPSYAQGGGGGGGGNGGGGGGVKKTTVRWTGTITSIKAVSGGVEITLGTSYYAVGTGIATSDTKISLNGASSVPVSELRVGDVAEMRVFWPSRIIQKMEVTGDR